MAIRDIVLYPDGPLTGKAQPFDGFGPEVEELAADLFETMETYDGCGLAGPQIGLDKRIFVLQEPETQTEDRVLVPRHDLAPGLGFSCQ